MLIIDGKFHTVFLVERVLCSPLRVPFEWWLILFSKQTIFDDEVVHFSTHEAEVAVFWGANDRFSTDVERRVDQDAMAGLFFESLDQVVGLTMRLPAYGLNPGGIINMGDRRDVRAWKIKTFDAPNLLLLLLSFSSSDMVGIEPSRSIRDVIIGAIVLMSPASAY